MGGLPHPNPTQERPLKKTPFLAADRAKNWPCRFDLSSTCLHLLLVDGASKKFVYCVTVQHNHKITIVPHIVIFQNYTAGRYV